MNKIKIMIVDDINEIRDYFSSVVQKEPDMEVITTAISGVETIQKLKVNKPDVILMDIQMESKTAGIDATVYIRKKYPQIKIIILTINQEDELLFQAYDAGAMDYIIKSNPSDQIINAIRSVHANNLMLRPDVAKKIVSECNKLRSQQKVLINTLTILTRLTNSEFEVLKCIYEGNSYKTVAEARFVSQATIKTQVNSILKKFEMSRMKDVLSLLENLDFYEITKVFYRN
jgi:DNA-binding NarL/FixJ family response regulator